MASDRLLTITPLGGLGEIGMNCMAFDSGDSMALVDCGLMFPDDFLYGVDVAIPRFDFLLENKERIKGIVLTHGHEDHIGALPWLLPYVHAPVYGSRFTLGLVENKLREHGLDRHVDLRPVQGGDRVEMGELAFTFIPVCHSIIEGYGLGIETPAGRVVHSGDFKIDRNPLGGHATDLKAFARFARGGDNNQGTLLLLSDSTNVERDGHALTEREIKESFRDIFAEADGRIIVSLFSSHVQRIQEIIELARETGRKVAVSGKSLIRNVELARDLDLLSIPGDTLIALDELDRYPDNEILLLVTGSQGEPLAALSRMSVNDHRQVRVKEGDLVILSSRFIPGNVKAITRVINNLYRLGAEVLYERVQHIHASGHAYRDELKTMLHTVNPKYFLPVHGEYRHLVKHRALAVGEGVADERALILENGQPISFLKGGGLRFEEECPAEMTLVDGKGVGDVGHTVLKERQLLGGEGMVIVLLVVDEATGEITIGPDIVSKGFIFEQQFAHLLEDAKCIVLEVFENIPPGDTKRLKERIRSTLRKFFRKVLERDPVVVPLVIEV